MELSFRNRIAQVQLNVHFGFEIKSFGHWGKHKKRSVLNWCNHTDCPSLAANTHISIIITDYLLWSVFSASSFIATQKCPFWPKISYQNHGHGTTKIDCTINERMNMFGWKIVSTSDWFDIQGYCWTVEIDNFNKNRCQLRHKFVT